MSSVTRRFATGVTIVALAVGAAACGSDSDSSSTTAAPTTTAGTATTTAAGAGGTTTAAAGSTVGSTPAASGVTAEGISDEECAANKAAGKITYLSSFDFSASASIVDVIVAKEKGYFEDMCLDVELKPGFSTTNYPLDRGEPGPVLLGRQLHRDPQVLDRRRRVRRPRQLRQGADRGAWSPRIRT